MFAKLTICAAVALLGADEAAEQKPAETKKSPQTQNAPVQNAPAEKTDAALVKKESKSTKAKKKSKAKNSKKNDRSKLIAIERNIVKYTNEERRRHGLPEFKVDHDLVDSARQHCQWMTRNQTLQHTGAAVAENIAMGYRNSNDAVRAWMNSSGHRANILNGGHGRIGVAAYRTESGTIFWCQQFRR